MFEFLFKKKDKKRSFSGASVSRLTSDWTTTSSTPNSDVYADLGKLKTRSRNLVQNNGYAKKFINSVRNNVVGSHGLILQCMAKDNNGTYDKAANDIIEEAWQKWAECCDVTRKMSLIDVQDSAIEAVAQDGEVIIRMVKNFKNEFGFALQLIEADHLDINLNDADKRIVMGIEMDEYNSPIAYWITKGHPSSTSYRGDHIRIPADEIIHLYKPLRIGQVRGVPWLHAGMGAIHMLDKYQEAELTAARVAAGKMGFYKTPSGDEYHGEKDNDDVLSEVEPGTFEELPQGWDFQAFDPQHPTTAYQEFTKTVLRSVASALGVSYESLSNDREGVNYSSIRQGALEERDQWKALHTWLGRHLMTRVYTEWLPIAMLKNKVSLPVGKIDKFMNIKWQARGFAWVDVYKEAVSNVLLAKAGLKSHQEIVSEQGKNIEDVYAQIAKEKAERERLGIITDFDAELLDILTQGVNNGD